VVARLFLETRNLVGNMELENNVMIFIDIPLPEFLAALSV